MKEALFTGARRGNAGRATNVTQHWAITGRARQGATPRLSREPPRFAEPGFIAAGSRLNVAAGPGAPSAFRRRHESC